MESPNNNDSFIRDLVSKKGLETPPEDFTEKLMLRIHNQPIIDNTPLLSRGTWISIIAAAAAVIVIIFTVDLPFIDQIFSSTNIRNISMNIFSKDFFGSMVSFFHNLNISSISIAILIAASGLIIMERILRRRFLNTRLFLLSIFS